MVIKRDLGVSGVQILAARRPAASTEKARVGRGSNEATDPTGVWVEEGETYEVVVSGLDGASAVIKEGYWSGSAKRRLAEGTNTFVASTFGPLVLIVNGDSNAPPVRISISGDKLDRHPLFVLGKTSVADWRRQLVELPTLLEEDDLNSSDSMLYSGQAILMVRREGALENADTDVAVTMEGYNRGLEAMNAKTGLNSTTGGPDGRIEGLQLLVSRDCCYMYANGFYAGYNRSLTYRVLRAEVAPSFWGIFHEFGHNWAASGAISFDGTGEVSPNIFAMAARVADYRHRTGDNSRAGLASVYRPTVLSGLAAREKKIAAGANTWAGLGHDAGFSMLVQLEWLLGEDAMPAMFTLERTDSGSIPRTDGQRLMYLLSKANGVDVREFFTAWYLPPTDQTNAAIDALGLTKKLTAADANVVP